MLATVGDRQPVRWQVKPLERTRRGLDERIRLAAPKLNRQLSALLLQRLRGGSWLRRAALTRAVRVGFAANNRGDYDSLEVIYHPEVEIYPPLRGRGIGVDSSPSTAGARGCGSS